MSVCYKCSTYYDDRSLLICIHSTFYNHFACIGVSVSLASLIFQVNFFISVYPTHVHNAIIIVRHKNVWTANIRLPVIKK